MKKLALVCLTLGALTQATGCFISPDPDPDTYGNFDVAWLLLDDQGGALGCGTNLGVTARVHSNRQGGPNYIDLFDCSAGGGVTADLLTGTYDVWVDILDANNALVAQSFAVTNLVLGVNQVPQIDFEILRDDAYMEASWELVDENTDEPLLCANGDQVSILATLVGPNTATDDIFDCDDGYGMTYPLPIGDYEVIIYLVDADENVLNDSGARTVNLEWGNQVKDLGHFIFEQP